MKPIADFLGRFDENLVDHSRPRPNLPYSPPPPPSPPRPRSRYTRPSPSFSMESLTAVFLDSFAEDAAEHLNILAEAVV